MRSLSIDNTKPAVYYLDLWIAALSSGRYIHCPVFLHPTSVEYCAYGVLCDLFVRFGDFYWVQSVDDPKYYNSRYAICKNSTFLPSTLRFLLGIDRTVDYSIVTLNDTTSNYCDTIRYLNELKNYRSFS